MSLRQQREIDELKFRVDGLLVEIAALKVQAVTPDEVRSMVETAVDQAVRQQPAPSKPVRPRKEPANVDNA